MEGTELVDLSNLPKDVDKLQLLVSDLARRLQNALHMVDAQKKLVVNATATCDKLRSRVSTLSTKLRLEISRNESYHKQMVKTEASIKYDNLKKTAGAMHDELRMAVLDHSMKFATKLREPEKIIKLKKKLETIEGRQESQKQYLQHISLEEQMTEDLANCCQHGRLEMVHTLLKKGANANASDSAGFLPIHYAAAGGFVDVVRLLLDFGSDVSSYLTGFSPLVICSQNGHAGVIRVLMDFGGDVEEKGKGGCPAIVAAANFCHRDCIETLLDYGADIHARDLSGNTPLHAAAKHEAPGPVVELLLARGADANLQNQSGSTPLQHALSIMNTAAVEALARTHNSESNKTYDFIGGDIGLDELDDFS